MKRKGLIFKGAALTALIMLSFTILAQGGYGRHARHDKGLYGSDQGYCQHLPGLTDEQKEQIDQLRVSHLKKVKDLKNELNEKMARQRTLMTADKANLDEINMNIDGITGVKNKLMKENAAHHQAVRALLTEEQRLLFDQKPISKGKHGIGQKAEKGYNF